MTEAEIITCQSSGLLLIVCTLTGIFFRLYFNKQLLGSSKKQKLKNEWRSQVSD